MRTPPWVVTILALLLSVFAVSVSADWKTDLEQRLGEIDEDYPGELGVFVHNLKNDEKASLRADEPWYLASTVKVPVAMAVMETIDRKDMTLGTTVTLEPTDFVDGAGETNWKSPGDKVTVQYLLEQMLIHSDNTATDVLIRLVGMEAVNELVAVNTDGGIGKVTTLADVRRHAYSHFHEGAMGLSSADMFAIKKAGTGRNRVQALAKVLGVTPDEFLLSDLDSAFDSYYGSGLNSGRLDDFSILFEALAKNQVLGKSGLPEHVRFAHKTGTQHRRACNIGLATVKDHPGVIIAACGRHTADLAASEKAFRQVGKAVADTGVFGED